MKTLETERLLLRPWSIDDKKDHYEYAKSKVVGPMAGWKPHDSIEESEKIIQMFIKEDETWAIVCKENGKVIGSVGLHNDGKRDLGSDKARMLGYVLSEEFWGQGIMTEACKRVMRFAFEDMNLEILSVCHYPFNIKSKRVIEKLGFHYEGQLRKATTIYDGTVYDDLCYSILREEYEQEK
ncbi:MAG TPA: GNAT family protein [Lachnospiraceae bacterium]|nr:GNAT family protein [Lachnospiraceae bacterium]